VSIPIPALHIHGTQLVLRSGTLYFVEESLDPLPRGNATLSYTVPVEQEFSIQYSVFSIQHSVFSIQYSEFRNQNSKFKIQSSS
jgi:hypothetical protein